MKVKFKRLNNSAILPKFQTSDSAGADLSACLSEKITLKPMERKIIPLGFSMEIPEGFEAQIRARSGLAIKHGISIINGIGTIDSDYRGEIKVILINLGNETFAINRGDRIAQLVPAPVQRATFAILDILPETVRNAGGFGSTGR